MNECIEQFTMQIVKKRPIIQSEGHSAPKERNYDNILFFLLFPFHPFELFRIR